MSRATELDALRGVAMVWMTVFHFCFDLSYLGLLKANFYLDPFWTVQRSVIVGLFLCCAGASQVMAARQGQSAARFWQRWVQIAASAMAVSVGSYLVFPQSYIYFGVLHGIAVMLLLLRWLPLGQLARLVLGAIALAAPVWAQQAHASGLLGAAMDSRAWNWLGLVSHKPVTEDYVPLLPWLGVVLWAQAATHFLLQRWPQSLQATQPWLQNPTARAAIGGLARLGRWSLSYYLLHQPVMLGLLVATLTVLGQK